MLALALFTMAFFLALTSCVMSYAICYNLSNRKIEVDYIFLSWNMKKYMRMYKEITKEESGQVGKLYYLTYIFFLLAVLSFLGGIISLYS